MGKMRVTVLRVGHRLVRDDRATTHAALVSRAFGAEGIFMTGIDQSVVQTLASVQKRWGGQFKVEVIDDWKALIKNWKKDGGIVVHLTMYGININQAIKKVPRDKQILVVAGSEKVPREVYELADFNIAVGNQPHSEVAALAIFLDRIFAGSQFSKKFPGGALRISPMKRGKKVVEQRTPNVLIEQPDHSLSRDDTNLRRSPIQRNEEMHLD